MYEDGLKYGQEILSKLVLRQCNDKKILIKGIKYK